MDIIIFIGLIVTLIIIYIIYKMFWGEGGLESIEREIEVKTEEDSPYLKQIGDFRNTLLKHATASFSIIWGTTADSIDVHVENNDWHSHIVIFIYRNQMARLYIKNSYYL